MFLLEDAYIEVSSLVRSASKHGVLRMAGAQAHGRDPIDGYSAKVELKPFIEESSLMQFEILSFCASFALDRITACET